MDNSFARKWAAVLNMGLRSLTSSPQDAWREQMPDLKALTGFQLQVEEQLSRAYIDYLRSAMTMDQLKVLWHYQAQEVQQTLREAALHICLPDSWLAQRILDVVNAWNFDLRAISRHPLQLGLSSFSGKLVRRRQITPRLTSAWRSRKYSVSPRSRPLGQ
jgi:hypothetical protein